MDERIKDEGVFLSFILYPSSFILLGMEAVFSDFLRNYFPDRPRLLLGLSGGPDSMALLRLLLAEAYPFEVAHIDHGWRLESRQEAEELEGICRTEGISFHIKRLKPPEQRNVEDEARKARLAFFREVLEKEGLEGVLLAHQADDQAETVLKRIFEGASLSKLKGLVPRVELEGMVIYRPLLTVRKADLLKWLEERKIQYFQDTTNLDPRFLRGRLRATLMPFLSSHFGKEVAPSLCRVGEAAAELGAFLEEQMRPYTSRIRQLEAGVALDFAPDPPTSSFLWKAMIRSLFDSQRVALSNAVLEAILDHLQKGNCHKRLNVGGKAVRIHRKELTIQ